MSISNVGTLTHGGSSQWKAMTGGVTIAVYANKSAIMTSQKMPKGERGNTSFEAGIKRLSGPMPKTGFLKDLPSSSIFCKALSWLSF